MERERSLDGLRGVAVLAVLGVHAGVPGLTGGARGVDMFFVLSGFLITTILKTAADGGGIDYRAFWLRRALRLMPALILFLSAYLALAPLLFPAQADTRWRDAAWAGTYVMNYISAARGGMIPLGHTWSLAVEMQFYLAWPFVVACLVRHADPLRLLLIGWAALTFLRLAILGATLDSAAAYFPLHAHATGLVLGAALAFAPQLKLPAIVGWLAVTAFVALLFLEDPADNGMGALTWGISCAEVATAAMLAALKTPSSLSRALSWPPLAWFGLISYGVYLWHAQVGALFAAAPWWLELAAMVGVAGGIAAASFYTVERWARELGRPYARAGFGQT